MSSHLTNEVVPPIKMGESVTRLIDVGSSVVRVKRSRYAQIYTTVQFIVPPDHAHSLPQAFAEVGFSEKQLADFIAALTIGGDALPALERLP